MLFNLISPVPPSHSRLAVPRNNIYKNPFLVSNGAPSIYLIFIHSLPCVPSFFLQSFLRYSFLHTHSFIMHVTFAHLASTFLAFSDLINAYANPLACSGVCGNSHDPAVIKRTSDGKYFRFSTGNKISVATASSLRGPWVAKGSAITAGSKINKKGKDDLWVRVSGSPSDG